VGRAEESGASNKVKTQSITTIAVVIAKADLLEISLFVQNVTKDMTKWMANQFFRETVKTVKKKIHVNDKKRCMNHRRQKSHTN